MGNYEAVIGLEVHVHLATKTKLFCGCSNRFGLPPNTNVCEVCTGMPGSLPSPNREAIHLAALVGMAANCKINLVSQFARKNYFYPDLPAGYQISQFELPICEHGWLEIGEGKDSKRIGITRIHMENDAGKNVHSASENASFVDLNRAGTPLIEIVSEPDMRSSNDAVQYLKKLHNLVTYLGASDGNMEEGSFRCDANVSIRPKGSDKLGIRAELKNLNSFRNVQKAIDYEIERQEDILESGGQVVQETRLYDSGKNITQSMRGKEEAQDYRYFPDPDLPPVEILSTELQEWRESIPELPYDRRERFMREYGLSEADAEFMVQNKPLADFFEVSAKKSDAKKTASYILGPFTRECNAIGMQVSPKSLLLTAEDLAELVNMIKEGLINDKIANDIFSELCTTDKKPRELVQEKGLAQISDNSAIESAVDKAIEANPSEVEAYKGGKTKLLSFFVGQVMRSMHGKANPAVVNELLKKKLG